MQTQQTNNNADYNFARALKQLAAIASTTTLQCAVANELTQSAFDVDAITVGFSAERRALCKQFATIVLHADRLCCTIDTFDEFYAIVEAAFRGFAVRLVVLNDSEALS